MQKQKCSLEIYSDFLIATQNRYSGVELSKVSPVQGMEHDAVSRWLAGDRHQPSELWGRVKGLVDTARGYLIGDDTVLNKEYSRANELARKQYSGNEHRIVNGIGMVNLLWTKGEEFIPVDYRIYQKEAEGKSKNELFREMLKKAKKRGFSPLYALMDAWYSSIENLKVITGECEWQFICNVKGNRQVSVLRGFDISISDLELAKRRVRQVWLKGYGPVMVGKLVSKDGDITYLVSSDLSVSYRELKKHWKKRWKIEEFHRGLKQTTGIEKCYSTKAVSQKTHIFAALTAFIKMEWTRLQKGISWYEQKAMIGRYAVFRYLKATA